MMNIFTMHTSTSLTLNENAGPTERRDFEHIFNRTVPENDPDYLSRVEAPDDLPEHIKSSLLGSLRLVVTMQGE